MPPRRAKQPVKPASSSSDSESDHEASAKPSIASKLASKFKSIVGLEGEESKPAPATKKRKRASSVERRDVEVEVEEAEVVSTKKKAPVRKSATGKNATTPRKPPAKRTRKSAAAVAEEAESSSEDELAVAPVEEEVVSPRKKAPARKTATSTAKTTPRKPPVKRTRKTAAVVAAEEEANPSSEDELAVAPVSPVKPRPKGKGKAAAATTPQKSTAAGKRKSVPTSTRKSTTASAWKSTSASARKTRKAQDEYDSSMRELTHSSDSPTSSESDHSRASADYDPKLDNSTNKRELDESDAEEAALETMEVDSEALDDESDFGPHKIALRASASPAKKQVGRASGRKSVGSSGRKSVGKRAKKEESESEEYESDGPLAVAKIVRAPETGWVPAGQISKNTFDFLLNLQDPDKNDREWFKLHDPIFRLAEKEWVAFVEAWITMLVDVDDEIPPLPPKDIIHRIYRDVRFSNDKTPYKPNFSASTSRSGRKGIFAAYHISIKPGGGSLVAAGLWCPAKDELASIRNVIKRNHGSRLRQIIAEPSFVKLFGPPTPLATKGKERKRQSIFGAEDELKVAPAGVSKTHPDIDLLKCRSFAVVHRFTDAQVLRKDFLEKTLRPVLEEMKPFVHCLNDYMTVPLDDMTSGSSSSSSSSDEE